MNDHVDEVRLSLGAYALGTLEPSDEARVEAHLASCPECLAELEELASAVPALAALSAEDINPPAPSEDMFAQIVAAVDAREQTRQDGSEPDASGADEGDVGADEGDVGADEGDVGASPAAVDLSAERRKRRPTRWLIAVAASVVLLGGAGAAVGVAMNSSPSHPGVTVASGVSGNVRLQVAASDSGSKTQLVLTAKGLPNHEHCHLVATAKDGSKHDAGRWDASYEGSAQVTELTDVPRSQLRSLTLYGNGGKRLVEVQT